MFKLQEASNFIRKMAIVLVVSISAQSLPGQSNTSEGSTSKSPTALVTFVDNGMSLAGGLPGQKSQSFRGKLFLEDQVMATMQPGHFITFALEPVEVEFTAQTWMAAGPTGGAHLKLNLVAGKHYFVEVRTKQSWPVTKGFGIKEITCKQAHEEHEHDKPLDASNVKTNGDPALIAETAFPACT